jgi:hypothetical protein
MNTEILLVGIVLTAALEKAKTEKEAHGELELVNIQVTAVPRIRSTSAT